MNETQIRLLEQFIRLETLMRRYQHIKFRDRGPFGNPNRGQGRVLSILKMQPEIGQKELGYLLDMSKQALAELLSKLEKNGYINRTQSEKDRRAYIITLTDAGRDALSNKTVETAETEDNPMLGAGFDCLNDEEQLTLCDYLQRMIAALEEKLGDTGDESDYAEFFRAQFFAHHARDPRCNFDERNAQWWQRGMRRGRFDGFGENPTDRE